MVNPPAFDPSNFISATNDLSGVTFTYSTGVSTTLSGDALKAWVTLYRAMLMMLDTTSKAVAQQQQQKKSVTKAEDIGKAPGTGANPYDR